MVLGASPGKVHATTIKQDAGEGEALVLFTTDSKLSRKALLRYTYQHKVLELTTSRDTR